MFSLFIGPIKSGHLGISHITEVKWVVNNHFTFAHLADTFIQRKWGTSQAIQKICIVNTVSSVLTNCSFFLITLCIKAPAEWINVNVTKRKKKSLVFAPKINCESEATCKMTAQIHICLWPSLKPCRAATISEHSCDIKSCESSKFKKKPMSEHE